MGGGGGGVVESLVGADWLLRPEPLWKDTGFPGPINIQPSNVLRYCTKPTTLHRPDTLTAVKAQDVSDTWSV